MDLRPGDRLFFFTTSGWMMWNFLVSTLLLGAVPVLYDGNPAYPDPDVLWQMAQDSGGDDCSAPAPPTSSMLSEGRASCRASATTCPRCAPSCLAGSPVGPGCRRLVLPQRQARPVARHRQRRHRLLHAASSAACPTLPVYAGEIQARIARRGRLRVQRPRRARRRSGRRAGDHRSRCRRCRSGFWNDDDGEPLPRRPTSHDFPGVWRHGDFFRVNERGGCFVLGRSDATLNRYGIRIGTAEIYARSKPIPEVADALIVNLDLPGGGFFMPLFVDAGRGRGPRRRPARHDPPPRCAPSTRPGTCPTRSSRCPPSRSPCTGKKMEVPVRKILLGAGRTTSPTATRWRTRRPSTTSPSTRAPSPTTPR